MRAAVAIVVVAACARAAQEPAASVAPADAGAFDAAVPVAADAGEAGSADAALPGAADGGGVTPGDATADAGDAGGAIPLDAGFSDSGLSFSPIVGADAGPVSLVVTPEPGSPCASWLPAPSEPETISVEPQYGPYIWTEPVSDGRGDLGVLIDGTFWDVGFISDGEVSLQGSGGWITPQQDNFLYVSMQQPCLMCWPYLMTWPAGKGSVFLGTGYPSSTNCTFASRPAGGVYTSCVGPAADGGVVQTFARYDEFLGLVASGPGDGMDLVAVDATDRVVERSAGKQLRWLDSDGSAITAFFAGGTGLQRLIGGGFLEGDGRLIPSGSSTPAPAPPWLTGRSSVFIVLGGRAYALGSYKDCGLVIRDADGALCGSVDVVNCRSSPRPGIDGTIAFPLNLDPYYVRSQTLAVWRGLLR